MLILNMVFKMELLKWIYTFLLIWMDILKGVTTIPQGCNGNVDLAFALDSSESTLDSYDQLFHTWDAYKNFIKTVVQLLPSGTETKISTLRFSSTTDLLFNFNKYDKSINIQDAIVKMDFLGGNTNLAQAFTMTKDTVFQLSNGDRSGSTNILVILTDGLSNIDNEKLNQSASLLKSTGTEIYAIASSKEMHEENLKSIASLPTDKYLLSTTDVSQLNDLALVLAHRICGLPEPSATTTPAPSCMENCLVCKGEKCETCVTGMYYNGLLCVDCMENCDTCKSATECELCKVGWYWDPSSVKCEVCELQADLTLLIDNSGSIRDKNPDDNSYDNYQLLKNFIINLLSRLVIGPDATRVAAIRFSTISRLEFTLDQYTTRDEMANHIDNLAYDKGHTNTSGAIRLMREKVFKTEKGDRPGIRNIGLIITDGESTKDSNLTIPESQKAKSEGVAMFVVGVTDQINEQELKEIASSPVDQHFFNSTEIIHLDKILTELTKHVCAPENPSIARSKRDMLT